MRIVLANDAELLLNLERSALTRQNVELVTASDPLDLLDLVTESPPELVLLSRRVGEMSGAELCRRLKADSATAIVPVVLLDRKEPSLDAGAFADRCLAPPVDRATLIGVIAELLGLPRRGAPRVRSRLRVEYFGGAIEGVGHTKDLSAGGAFVRTADAFEPGTELQLIFDLPGESHARIRAGARVARSVPHHRDSHLIAGVGVSFLRMSDRDRDEIRQFVDRGGARHVV